MPGKFISSLAAAAVLLLFFLPWVTVGGNGAAAGQFFGYELALGGGGVAGPTLWLVPLAAVVVLALLFLAIMNGRLTTVAGFGQGAAALVGLLVLGWQWWQIENEPGGFSAISLQPALWATIAALLLIPVGLVLDQVAARRQRPQRPAPVIAPRHLGHVGNRPPAGVRTIVDWPDEGGQPDFGDNSRPQPGAKTIVDDPPARAPIPSTASLGPGSPLPKRDLATDVGLDAAESMPARRHRPQKTDLSTDFGDDSLPPGRLSPKTEVLQPEPGLLAWLVIRSGEPMGKQFRLRRATTIGRDPDSDIHIDDTAVSGKHAHVKIEDGHFFIYDRGSANGVLVYEPESDRWQKVERHELKDGTQIKLGRTVLHLMTLAVDDQ